MKNKRRTSIFSIRRYFIIFAAIAFVVSINFRLFLTSVPVGDELRTKALLVFWNIILLSLILCVVEGIQRKISIEKPIKSIMEVTEELSRGNFSARIPVRRSGIRSNEFDDISENINKMAVELGSIETLRSDFVSNVSHEIRTPLSVISNYATMLQAEDISGEQRKEYAEAINSAAINLSELISNILKLNKLENQQIFTEFQRYDLGDQLCECLLGFESIWEEKNIEIETDIRDGVFINSDRDLLSLVWNNLLSNAFKFTESGGKVEVSVREENGFAVVEIIDSGCGMSAETQKHIFDKFYQGDTSHAVKGNGLGLALVKRIIDITKAEISVDSDVGKGSNLTVRLRAEGT